MQENIFKPLKMKSTSFQLKEELKRRMAVGATLSVMGQFVDVPQADYILRASSSALSTLEDMERFAFMLASHGSYEAYVSRVLTFSWLRQFSAN